jgi:hypothetical protein
MALPPVLKAGSSIQIKIKIPLNKTEKIKKVTADDCFNSSMVNLKKSSSTQSDETLDRNQSSNLFETFLTLKLKVPEISLRTASLNIYRSDFFYQSKVTIYGYIQLFI